MRKIFILLAISLFSVVAISQEDSGKERELSNKLMDFMELTEEKREIFLLQLKKEDELTEEQHEVFNKMHNSLKRKEKIKKEERKKNAYSDEQMPTFPGGAREMEIFISKNLQYPAEAQKDSINGRVFVRFVISENGEISDVTVAKGIHPLCDLEAVRVIKRMPKWSPGTIDGIPVSVTFTVPVQFKMTK